MFERKEERFAVRRVRRHPENEARPRREGRFLKERALRFGHRRLLDLVRDRVDSILQEAEPTFALEFDFTRVPWNAHRVEITIRNARLRVFAQVPVARALRIDAAQRRRRAAVCFGKFQRLFQLFDERVHVEARTPTQTVGRVPEEFLHFERRGEKELHFVGVEGFGLKEFAAFARFEIVRRAIP